MKYITSYLLHYLPHHWLTKWAGRFTKSPLSKYAIKAYVLFYNINLTGINRPVNEFSSLNDFFTRKLQQNARPIHSPSNSIVSPVDGLVQQVGAINNGALIQAKNVTYSVEQLLANEEHAKWFKNGTYLTIYLSPRDYHRVHAPVKGVLTGYSYVPGRLYPVNKLGVHSIPGIYTKNERITSFMDTEVGKVAVVKIGALIVGSVQLALEKRIEKLHKGRSLYRTMENLPIQKGEELGHFEFGSTVILLFEATVDHVAVPGQYVEMGENIGYSIGKITQRIN